MYGMFAYKFNKLNVQSYFCNRKCTKKNNFITCSYSTKGNSYEIKNTSFYLTKSLPM